MQNCNYFCTNLVVKAPGVVWLTGYLLDRVGLGNMVPDIPSLSYCLECRLHIDNVPYPNKILSKLHGSLEFYYRKICNIKILLGHLKMIREAIHCHQIAAGDYFYFVVAPFLHVKLFAKA